MTDLPGHYIGNGCQRCWLEAIRFIRYRKKIIATFRKKKKKCLDYNDEQGEMNLSFELTGLLISMVRVPAA